MIDVVEGYATFIGEQVSFDLDKLPRAIYHNLDAMIKRYNN